MTITDKEKAMLIAITKDDFFNGDSDDREDLEYLAIWTDCFLDTCGMDMQTAKGVLGSLTKKELIRVTGGADSTISFTNAGIEQVLALGAEPDTTPITEGEGIVLYLITKDTFFEGDSNDREDLEDLAIWEDCFIESQPLIRDSVTSAVKSLAKKELIRVNDNIISLTNAGIERVLAGGL